VSDVTPERLLSELIRLDTTNPPGNESDLAFYLKTLFDEAGIPNEIIAPAEGRGSFIARLGRRGKKRLLFLAHSDVVPPGEGWDFAPFSGEIREGMVYGRGALDCKSLLAAQAFCLLQLAREQFPLQGELIFAATADEERGGALGIKHLLHRYPEKLQADFAVNEGAELPIDLGKQRVYFLQVGEKGTAWTRLTARGRSCHGSVPSLGDNAVVKLARAVAGLGEYRSPVKLVPEVKYLLQELARIRGLEIPVREENIDQLLESLDLEHGFTETLRAMTRLTASPNVSGGGSRVNVVPDLATAEVDVRILPGQDRDYVLRELRSVVGEELEMEITEYREPSFTSAATEYYRLLEQTLRETAGEGVLCLPMISAGSTDSKHLRAAGIPAYGIAPLAPGADPELRTTIHGCNERIDIASLHFMVKFLDSLARRYLG
jgi:acetylornithine deacetylase/succinyl-diaminopimelate desuccinylase-like protein